MFKLDSPLMNFLSKVADIMILNILIIVCSIPVFTVGAAVSAAYYMTFKMVKNEETYIVRGFFKAFKENFKQATVMWLLVLLIIGILSVDYTIIVYSGIEFSRWIRLAMVTVSMILLMGVVYTAGAVYQPRQKHDQKFVFDGALAPADNSASDCRVRRAGGGILLCPAESADSDSAGVWHDCLSKVLPASARV